MSLLDLINQATSSNLQDQNTIDEMLSPQVKSYIIQSIENAYTLLKNSDELAFKRALLALTQEFEAIDMLSVPNWDQTLVIRTLCQKTFIESILAVSIAEKNGEQKPPYPSDIIDEEFEDMPITFDSVLKQRRPFHSLNVHLTKEEDVLLLSNFLKCGFPLTHLKISTTNFGARAIVRALKENTTLKNLELTLENDGEMKEDKESFETVLQETFIVNKTVKSLSLLGWDLSSLGLIMQANQGIKNLKTDGVREAMIPSLVEGLKGNSDLKILKLQRPKSEGAHKILTLQRSKGSHHCLGVCCFADSTRELLVDLLRTNRNITHLDCSMPKEFEEKKNQILRENAEYKKQHPDALAEKYALVQENIHLPLGIPNLIRSYMDSGLFGAPKSPNSKQTDSNKNVRLG